MKIIEEKVVKGQNGFVHLLLSILISLFAIYCITFSSMILSDATHVEKVLGFLPPLPALLLGIFLLPLAFIWLAGLKILKPNEAYVFTFFGKYYGTLKGEGFYWVNPLVSSVNGLEGGVESSAKSKEGGAFQSSLNATKRKISLKTMTLSNGVQKINDALGNPIMIGVVVIWRVKNTARASFNVENYLEYLSTQTDAALRNTVRQYPYDGWNSDSEMSLQGSSLSVAEEIRKAVAEKVENAGLEIIEARITHLAYAPEIASAMLQRQQASAIIDARAMIVDGATSMVKMALADLDQDSGIHLSDSERARMVSNLLVVLCGNRDVQPVVQSGDTA